MLELDLGQAIFGSTPEVAAALAADAAERTRSAGDETAEALARVRARPPTALSSPTIRPSTRSRRAPKGECRCSSKPTTTQGWSTSGMRSRTESPTGAPLRGLCARIGAALRHARFAGQRRSELFRLDRAPPTAPSRRRGSSQDRRAPSREPHPSLLLTRAWLLLMLPPTPPRSSRARRAAVARAHGDDHVNFMLGFIAQTAGDRERAAEACAASATSPRRAARSASFRPTHRCSADRSASSAATTRPSRSPSSGAHSTRQRTTCSRRHSGDRSRRSSTPAAAATWRRKLPPARRSPSSNRPTR